VTAPKDPDPVVALCRERHQLRQACNAQAGFVEDEVDQTWEKMRALDEVICDTLATTIDGLILQLHLLLVLHDEGVADDRSKRLLMTITRGIRSR
jgi:hypothetical protein